MQPKEILFLYSELAGYVIAGLKEAGSCGHHITVLHWPVNPEAPFTLEGIANVEFIERKGKDAQQPKFILEERIYDTVLCSGWIDKGYLLALQSYGKRSPVVLTMDTQWTGNLKQQVFAKLGGYALRKLFSHAWVAGEPQAIYAHKMGFDPENVRTGFYTADSHLFERAYNQRKEQLKQDFPHSFVYVGRYVEHKGISDLWQAFIAAKEAQPNDWKLICIGTGEDYETRAIHPDIEHLGFMQPSDLQTAISDKGVFVLPSHFEPWGVVVHEMALAGFPLVLSRAVGAASRFLTNGKNGYSFAPADMDDLQATLTRVMCSSQDELLSMSVQSHHLGQSHGLQKWGETLLHF